jgi:hypothetical protein
VWCLLHSCDFSYIRREKIMYMKIENFFTYIEKIPNETRETK